MFRFAQHDSAISEMSSDVNVANRRTGSETQKKLRRVFSAARSFLTKIRLNQALFFEVLIFLHCALSCANCSGERILFAWVRKFDGCLLCNPPSYIRLATPRSCSS